MNKQTTVSTDLFANKNVPDFFKTHDCFKKAVKLQKVFPSIGLPNFKEEASITKCVLDIKKEGAYVFNLLKVMYDILDQAAEDIRVKADRIQYLETAAVRVSSKKKLNDMYSLLDIINSLSSNINPSVKETLDGTIQYSENKISLRLIADILDHSGKPYFRKGKGLFSIFNDLKEKCTAIGTTFVSLEQTEQFKIFSKENIPNKKFCIVFSSTGEEGAWDIATMSMRGIKSCQRWDGEYPKCLIGSILSKFVAVMYLTSGVQADNYPDQNGKNWGNLGTKMMRRCVVRYAIDADEEKPCIIIDKMYPEVDKDILKLFVDTLSSKTKVPIHYAPEMGNKLRHIYIPFEKIREEVLDREWSYQDTPLKSKHDLHAFLLNFNKEEIEREVAGFKINLSIYLARRMEEIYTNNHSSNVEVKKTISNIRMNTSFTPFCNHLSSYIMAAFRAPSSKSHYDSKMYYRKYLMNFLLERKKIFPTINSAVADLLVQNTSRVFDNKAFLEFISSVSIEFVKKEIKNLIN